MRQIPQSVGVGLASVSGWFHRAEAAGLGWPLAPSLDDLALERLLYPGPRLRVAAEPRPARRGALSVWTDRGSGVIGGYCSPAFMCQMSR